jgi:RimJ/RimL family protein N-acetyltransferase
MSGVVVPAVPVPTELRGVVLTGRDVTLRPPQPERDADELFAAAHADPELVWTYMGYGPFSDRDQFHDWIAGNAASTDPLFLTVVSNLAQKAIGMVSILNADLANRRLELGHIWYVPSAQRTSANTEVTLLLLIEAFEHYRCRRVEWKCDSLNARSRRAAERLGFTFEGVFRNHMIVKGRNRDTAWFAMTDDEWPDRKQALLNKLA